MVVRGHDREQPPAHMHSKTIQFTSNLLFQTQIPPNPPSITKNHSLHLHQQRPVPDLAWSHHTTTALHRTIRMIFFPHCLHLPYHLSAFMLAVYTGRRAGKVNSHRGIFFIFFYPDSSFTLRAHWHSLNSLLVWYDRWAPPLDRSSATFSIRVQWKTFDRPASSPHYRMRVGWEHMSWPGKVITLGTSKRDTIWI